MKSFRTNSSRSGMTLVELVAGMTLLATLAASVLLALGVHQKQLHRAAKRINAIAAADRLLAGWSSGSGEIPRNTFGQVVLDENRWIWTTRTIDTAMVESLRVEKIRVEIYEEGAADRRQPLAFVELMAPAEHQPPTFSADSRSRR